MIKSVYALQPYYVGSKKSRSLAIVLPAHLVRKFNFNESTIFVVRTDQTKNIIILESIVDLGKSEGLGGKISPGKFEHKTHLDRQSIV